LYDTDEAVRRILVSGLALLGVAHGMNHVRTGSKNSVTFNSNPLEANIISTNFIPSPMSTPGQLAPSKSHQYFESPALKEGFQHVIYCVELPSNISFFRHSRRAWQEQIIRETQHRNGKPVTLSGRAELAGQAKLWQAKLQSCHLPYWSRVLGAYSGA